MRRRRMPPTALTAPCLDHRDSDVSRTPERRQHSEHIAREDSGRADLSREIMESFARSSGLVGELSPRRYLWTDAFAVCNYLGLWTATGEDRYRESALRLIDQVHRVLGRHREDDPRSGWISGLPPEEGDLHPTAGGLRIGKPLPERARGEPPDPREEWERDGQYYHYLTRWMHALSRTYVSTGDTTLHRWAVELAEAAHGGFVRRDRSEPYMVWKMSIDLSRPLVPSMGAHDPLDGLLTLIDLDATAPDGAESLRDEIAELAVMCRGRRWATDDPLGVGGLLVDLHRAVRMAGYRPFDAAAGDSEGSRGDELTAALLADALPSLDAIAAIGALEGPADRRLAFRELGLAIGLAALERLEPGDVAELPSRHGTADPSELLERLQARLPMREEVLKFWLDPNHRRAGTWTDHEDINRVMLATALAPDGYLG